MKQRLTELCCEFYREFMAKNKSADSIEIGDPIKAQMWHHSFNPHKEVAEVPMASLKAQPQSMRSESVRSFLNKTNIQRSLVKSALDISRAGGNVLNMTADFGNTEMKEEMVTEETKKEHEE